MKNIFTFVLLCMSYSVCAQNLNLTTSYDNIPSSISLKELSKMQFGENSGNKAIIELYNGTSYVMDIDKISSTDITTRESVFTKGEYANIKMLKTFNSLDELNIGDIVGIIDTLDYSAEDYIKTVYGDLYGLEKVLVPALNVNVKTLAAENLTTSSNIRIHAVDLVYVSTDNDGTKIPMSERIIFPYSTSRAIELHDILVESHYTVTDYAGSPTKYFWSTLLNGMVTKGYLFVSPDYQGLGITSDRSQLYLDIDNNPRHAADGLIAVKNYVNLSKRNSQFVTANLSSSAMIENCGMSQGAGNAMALTYYMENCLDQYRASKLPMISHTNICAGALDLYSSIDECFATDSLHYPPLLPLIISTAVVSHPEIMRDADGTRFTVHDYFVPELKTKTWDTTVNGLPGENTLWQMLYSKQVQTVPIVGGLVSSFGCPDGKMFGAVLIHKIIREGIITPYGKGYKLNPNNKYGAALIKFAQRNNLCDTNLWVPKSDISITHDTNDELVPYSNSQNFVNNMSAKMRQNGSYVELNTVNASGLLHFYFCMAWVTSELTGLPLSTVINLMKSSSN